jgi:hypothetical protein
MPALGRRIADEPAETDSAAAMACVTFGFTRACIRAEFTGLRTCTAV